MPPLPGSPTINAYASTNGNCGSYTPNGGSAIPIITDQRGVTRSQLGRCDIGAVESQGFVISAGNGGGQSASVASAFGTPLGVLVFGAYGEPVNGGYVTLRGREAARASPPRLSPHLSMATRRSQPWGQTRRQAVTT